ncbi:MAG: DUF262 domain-containing protein [Candidatus Zixiibacteriota bacterium]
MLYGLLPNGRTKLAKRVSIAPAFLNIRRFFKRFEYTDEDWREIASLVFKAVCRFEKNPGDLENIIRDFVSSKHSKALQCGSLSPIFYSLNTKYPIVNNRERRTFRALSEIVLKKRDRLGQKLEDYPTNIEKLNILAGVMKKDYGFKEIEDMAVLDLFCYWFDERFGKRKRVRGEPKTRPPMEAIENRAQNLRTMIESLKVPEPRRDFVKIQQFYQWFNENKMEFNTEYQRSYIWEKRRKQLLIDSILRGYDISTVFLRRIPFKEVYEVLDGQQRLHTIFDFLQDKFPVSREMGELLFSQLPDKLKWKFEEYRVWVVEITTDNDEITANIFLRLQEGLPLNAAEKLNAMTGFLRNEILELSRHPFMKALGIEDHRFAHRYILAQAYLLTLKNQITDMKLRNLQDIYVTYKEVTPQAQASATVKKVLGFLNRCFETDAGVIKHKADFITLYLFAKRLAENYATKGLENHVKEFFMLFLTRVGEVESSQNPEDVPYFDYKTWRKTSADSKKSVEKRLDIFMSKFLESVSGIEPKDPRRGFNYWEKLAVYRRDAGTCQTCRERTPFDEGTVDHVIPHSKGGPTTIENGQWLCTGCNLKKLDKVL